MTNKNHLDFSSRARGLTMMFFVFWGVVLIVLLSIINTTEHKFIIRWLWGAGGVGYLMFLLLDKTARSNVSAWDAITAIFGMLALPTILSTRLAFRLLRKRDQKILKREGSG